MTKEREIRVDAMYSNILSTSGHETATMEISKLDAKDILELSKSLGGEDAMAELIRFIDYHNDIESGTCKLKAVSRFYSNVRYLTEVLNDVLTVK